MKKQKILYVVATLFIVFSVLNFLLIFNTGFFLSLPVVKNFLISRISKSKKVRVNFKSLSGSLLTGKFEVDDIKVDSPKFNFNCKKLKMLINPYKLLFFKFEVNKLYLTSPSLNIKTLGKKNKSFKVDKLFSSFNLPFKAPFKLVKVIDGKFSWNLGQKSVEINHIYILGRVSHKQVLFEVKINKQSSLKSGYARLRLGNVLGETFGELDLHFKDLNIGNILSEFLKVKKAKTKINIDTQFVLEGNRVSISFMSEDSELVLWKEKDSPKRVIKIKYLQGIGGFTSQGGYLKISPIILEHPKLKADIEIDNSFIARFKVKDLNYPEFEKVLLSLFFNKKKRKWLRILVKGNFNEIIGWIDLKKLGSKDLTWVNLKAELEKGKVWIWFLPLKVKRLFGTLELINNNLKFKGRGIVGKDIDLTTKKLSILLKKPLVLDLFSTFYGKAYELKEVVSNFHWFSKGIAKQIFSSVNPIGKVKGTLKLRLKHKNGELYLNFDLKLKSKELLLSYPKKRLNVILKKASFWTDLKKYSLFAKEVKASGIILKNAKATHFKDTKLRVDSIVVSPQFLNYIKREFNFKYPYPIPKWKHLELKNLLLTIKKPINKMTLKDLVRGSRFEARLSDLIFLIPFKNKKLTLIVNKGSFSVNRGIVSGKLEGSVEGISFNATIFVNGSIANGTINAYISKTNFKELKELIPELKVLKTLLPLQIKGLKFKCVLRKQISLELSLPLYNSTVFYEFERLQKGWNSFLHIKGFCSNLSINIKKEDDFLFSNLKGRICASDFKKFFENRDIDVEGKIKTNVSIKTELPLDFVKNWLSKVDLNGGIAGWISYKRDSFNFNITFNDKKFEVKNLEFSTPISKGKGNLQGFFKDKVFIKGALQIKRLVLKKQNFSSSSTKPRVPIVLNLDVRADNVVLPTLHQVKEAHFRMVYDLTKNLLLLRLSKAKFGNIVFSGILKSRGDKHWIFLEVPRSKSKFYYLLKALYPKQKIKLEIRGKYQIEGYLYTFFVKNNLFYKASGYLRIKSKSGKIYRAPLLATILGALSPIDIFKGKLPNLKNGRIDYDSLLLEGYVKNHTFYITEIYLSATGFRLFGKGKVNLINKKLNLTVYVSPFKTIDVIVGKIPIIGKLLLSRSKMLVYVPLQVKGRIGHYKVKFLSFKSVERGVIDLLSKIFGGTHEFKKLKHQVKKSKSWWLEKRNEILKELSEYSF